MRHAKSRAWAEWSFLDRIYIAYSCLAIQLRSAKEFMIQDVSGGPGEE